MKRALDVSWEKLEEATKVYSDYYCKWRPKVEKGLEVETLEGVYREVVIEVTEESRARATFNWAEFPYEAPSRGELPGFFEVRETVEMGKLRQEHTAIYREAGFLENYGFWSELGDVSYGMALKMGKRGWRNRLRVRIRRIRMRRRRDGRRRRGRWRRCWR